MTSNMASQMAVVLILLKFSGAMGTLRIWKPISDYEEPDTWIPSQIPCYGDKVQLSAQQATLLPKKHAVSSLAFGPGSELILAEGGVLEVIDLGSFAQRTELADKRAEEHCAPVSSAKVNADGVFSVTGSTGKHNDWFDPSNWMVDKEDQFGHRWLDSERIPCNGDDVVFPSGHSFRVTMPSKLQQPVYLRSFKVGQLSFTQKLLAEYFGRPDVSSFFAAQNPAGQLESIASVLRKSVTGDGMDVPFLKTGEGETRQVCEANVGCKCGNDRKEVMDNLCPYIQQRNLSCTNPVKAAGRCYPFCGAVVTFTPAQVVPAMEQVQEAMRRLPSEYADDLNIHYSVLNDLNIQIIFLYSSTFVADQSGGDVDEAPHAAAKIIFDTLATGKQRYFVEPGTLELRISSGTEGGAAHRLQSVSGPSVGTIVGIVIGILLLILILTAVFIAWGRKYRLPFAFRQMDNNDNETVEMDQGPSFRNPLYRSGGSRNRRGTLDEESRSMEDPDLDSDMINRQFSEFDDEEHGTGDRNRLIQNEDQF